MQESERAWFMIYKGHCMKISCWNKNCDKFIYRVWINFYSRVTKSSSAYPLSSYQFHPVAEHLTAGHSTTSLSVSKCVFHLVWFNLCKFKITLVCWWRCYNYAQVTCEPQGNQRVYYLGANSCDLYSRGTQFKPLPRNQIYQE